MKFQPVAKAEREQLSQRGQEVRQSRDQRRTIESKAGDDTIRKPGAVIEPAKVPLPRSPIVAKPASQLGRDQTPPKAQSSPKPDPKFQPKPETSGRQPKLDRSLPQVQPRKLESEPKPAAERNPVPPPEKPVRPESQPRAKESGASAQGLEKKAQPAVEQPVRPRPDPNEKGATKLLRNSRQNAGQVKPAPRENPDAGERSQHDTADKEQNNKPKN